ncbi:Diaminopimelate decarboxylase [Chlamydia trachomatis]|nr:Diaminopimelate decarboxylase [Chlamydia trachomatis]
MLEINNAIKIDGVSIEELKETYGTPLYIYSVNGMKDRIAEIKNDFLNKYENTTVAYAAKAFLTSAMAKFIESEGLNLDVVSGGEIAIALNANFPAERIEFNGNNKLEEEIEFAVENNVGKFIIDGADELEIISKYAKKLDKTVKVLFRITPGVDAHTHEYIQTANVDSKFGFNLTDVLKYVQVAHSDQNINFLGYHFHIGSQLFENEVYLKAIDAVSELIKQTESLIEAPLHDINIGGGFGITYTDEIRKPYSYFLDPVMEKIEKLYTNSTRPHITIEPGRSIVGDSGYTLYTVGNIKNIPNMRKYVTIDGGMTDNIRPALYSAEYTALTNSNSSTKENIRLVGKCCESGDILIKDIELPTLNRGDLILVLSTGAYGHSMSSNYNSLPRPAVVFTQDGEHKLVVRRETYRDLVLRDQI